MAKVESLGIHSPVALPYLIREGILSPEPKKESYQWETYVCEDGPGEIEEELLVTNDCVVWSQGKSVRNVYRFELEGEDVAQAILTQFRASEAASDHAAETVMEGYAKARTNRRSLVPPFNSMNESPRSTYLGKLSSSRALVVFLKTKAHIYFINGAKHIISLPFEVERAFPAPRGCVLVRKPAESPAAPPTPQFPSAPPNSFFFSQSQTTASFFQSPTLARSFGRSQPVKPSPLGGGGRLDALFQDVFGSPGGGSNGGGVASLYSLTSPLADLGVLTYSLQHQKPRLLNRGQAGLSVEFESLDSAERVVYVSPKDELGGIHEGRGELTLIITINDELHTLTIWHAWYVEEKSLKELLKLRAVHKAAKARRRSSFLSAANIGTGTTTPGVRVREHPRESFAGAGSLRLPGDPVLPAQHLSRKTTKQEEEEVMAAQMDPDYQPAGASQQPARENRRISSLNLDTRASQAAVGASFAGAGGARQNTSFGGPTDRRSFGHRKSRGSTPGSTVFGRSLGSEHDDLMDLDSTDGDEGEESVEGIVRHIRATFEAAGADSVFGSVEEEFRRELVVRKLHSLPVNPRSRHTATTASFRVATLRDAQSSPSSDDSTLGLYLCDQSTREVTYLKLLVKQRPLWPEGAMEQSTVHVAVPVVVEQKALGKSADLIKLRDGNVGSILLAGRGLVLAGSDSSDICPLPEPNAPYRVSSPFDMPLPYSPLADMEVGRNCTMTVSQDTLSYAQSGVRAAFDEVDAEGTHHRRRLQLRPDDPHIDHLLEVCQIVLPEATVSPRQIWCMCFARLEAEREDTPGTGSSLEWLALVATVLFYGIRLLDSKTRAALNVSRVAVARQKSAGHGAFRLQKQRQENGVLSKPAWNWMLGGTTSVEPAFTSPNTRGQLDRRKDQVLPLAAALADEFAESFWGRSSAPSSSAPTCAVKLMLALHVAREEQKLCTLSVPRSRELDSSPIIAQLGHWLGLPAWSFTSGSYYDLEGASDEEWAYVKSTPSHSAQVRLMDEPVSVFQWFELAFTQQSTERYPTLATIAGLDAVNTLSASFTAAADGLTPRICALSVLLEATAGLTVGHVATVELVAKHGLNNEMLETLPQAIAAPFKEAMSHCERDPPTTWQANLFRLVGREDALPDSGSKARSTPSAQISGPAIPVSHDVQAVCHALEQHTHPLKTREAARHSVSQLIFSQDRRLVEAVSLMRYYSTQEAECAKQPDWSDAFHFDQQRRVIEFVTMRMWALPAGDGMLHYDCLTPLLTEKYTPYGFGSRCLMQPMGITLNIDRSTMSEEKFGWAYFHAGVSSGLRISKHVKGIDTSWVAFNKPAELTNRHAGLLLALGLGGHLRHVAKWMSFKYLTPKHTMTSVGLLLGLSASYIGTMDTLVTRMLSIHITRMLPAGAAELNVSPVAQTAGLMGIGLLYFNTQHRRMSEIMLSEIEYLEVEDPDSGPDPLRDESYRLAAGFALGLINLGKGRDLRGLHGMHLPERLLAVAVGSRPVHAVHVFDRATAGAIVAVTLIYMKSGDKAIAGKVNIPDTEAQFDHVRPDMLLLRAMAAHVITWHDIEVHGDTSWINDNLPACYQGLPRALSSSKTKRPLQTADVPFYNIITGLAWAVGLKYAGSGHEPARDDILHVLDMFYKIGTESYYYDAKLTRSTVRRCIDVLALAAATVMAGTGDLTTFRYLRRLHGRTDAETPYGSHMAAHLAIGVLFMGGGTYTFGTSDFAVASLICAFYPLFPADVHDNRVHLQAFRHFWVFAAEARCLVVDDIDTHRSIRMPVTVTLRDGAVRKLHAPCLLPELDTIAKVTTEDPVYWRVTLDFESNPQHLKAFRENQTVFVRRCPAGEAHSSVFNSTLAALNDSQISSAVGSVGGDLWQSVFSLPALRGLDKADVELILSPDVHSSVNTDERTTVVDDRLVLGNAGAATVGRGGRDELRNLRVLLAWAEKAKEDKVGEVRWLGSEVLEVLSGRVEERMRMVAGTEDAAKELTLHVPTWQTNPCFWHHQFHGDTVKGKMEVHKPSFMLLPSFGFLPDRDINLGTVLTAVTGSKLPSKLPDPKRPLNRTSRIAIDAKDIQPQTYKPWSWDSTKSRSDKLGLTADVSLLTGVGGSLAGEGGRGRELVIECDRVEVKTFRPDQKYLAQTLRDDLVKTVGWKLTRPPLYLVTGLMVAYGAVITLKGDSNKGFSGSANADFTSLGVPINAGPLAEHKVVKTSKLAGVPKEPFILAYELLKVRKKHDGTVEERDETKWALFSDDGGNVVDDDGVEAFSKDWDVEPVKPEEFVGDV
ncbi:Anaphase-promoting complex subunit 1 [Friedmanniomyces endolithicus]|nr:Anaphase-promoting complex subunit 1 [Friedmanniomyces endolithicus]